MERGRVQLRRGAFGLRGRGVTTAGLMGVSAGAASPAAVVVASAGPIGLIGWSAGVSRASPMAALGAGPSVAVDAATEWHLGQRSWRR